MPLDFNLLGQAPRINTPFEHLGAMLQIRNQQEAAHGLREQRSAIADERRQKAELARQEAEAAARVRALFSRPNQAPTPEELASVIGPDKATEIFKGFAELQKAQWANQDVARQSVASILGAVNAFPEPLRAGAYSGARQTLIQQGKLKPEDAPEKYSAEFVQNVLHAALTPKEQVELQKPLEVTAGSSLMSPDGKVIGTAPKPADTGSKPASVQEYEYAVQQDGFKGSFADYQNADANRKQKAAAERAPYFTYQPVFDPQGRPISAIRFDARGGPPQVVDVSAMTGGGQLKPPPGGTGPQAIADEVSTAQLRRLKEMFNRGGSAFVGPASGRWESMKQGVPGVPVNKTFAEFSAATAAFKNAVIKAITGAALSEAEASRIIKQIPDLTDKPDVWTAKAEQTEKNLQDLGKALQSKGASVEEWTRDASGKLVKKGGK